jgi:hypothetical protein
MATTNTTMMWTIVVLIAIALAIVIVGAVASARRRRMSSAELRARFGPEYDRAVQELGSRARAEHELAARARRVERIRLADLNDPDRARFASKWSRIQAEFVDDPASAVARADELIKEVMVARGYPEGEEFEQRVADLSVDHAAVVQHYRAARALSASAGKGEVSTEELRQAVVHYRALFADLLQEAEPAPRSLRERHA